MVPVEPGWAVCQYGIENQNLVIRWEFALALCSCVEERGRHPVCLVHVIIGVTADERLGSFGGESCVETSYVASGQTIANLKMCPSLEESRKEGQSRLLSI